MIHLSGPEGAREKALEFAREALAGSQAIERIVQIEDIFGRIRLVVWPSTEATLTIQELSSKLLAEISPYWSGDVWVSTTNSSPSDQEMYEGIWREAHPTDNAGLRTMDRYRNRGGWLGKMVATPWARPDFPDPNSPPILVFYSFKGGVGRSTALAAFAVQRARSGERVAVIDADFDAPGIGTLLTADVEGAEARYGVVDYLLERPLGEVDLSDYFHVCRRDSVASPGEIYVFPSGTVDDEYLGKLARLDLEPGLNRTFGIRTLLEDVRNKLKPNWILVDLRAGLADPAGELLSGLGHLHVLFGTFSRQSWLGLRLAIDRLGRQRLVQGEPQSECVIVQAMVRDIAVDDSQKIEEAFAERSLEVFEEVYYAQDFATAEQDETVWVRSDAESTEAPHQPIALRYHQNLAFFNSIEEVIDSLSGGHPGYASLGARISGRFAVEPKT